MWAAKWTKEGTPSIAVPHPTIPGAMTIIPGNTKGETPGKDVAPVAETYSPPPSVQDARDRWTGKFNGKNFEPVVNGENQKILKESVARAIDSGLFYNRDVNDFVAKELGVTDEQRKIGTGEVDGGFLQKPYR